MSGRDDKVIRGKRTAIDQWDREERDRILEAHRTLFHERLRALYAECAQLGHVWQAERLSDSNLSHLQRFGSTPQRCANCGRSRPIEEYREPPTPPRGGGVDE